MGFLSRMLGNIVDETFDLLEEAVELPGKAADKIDEALEKLTDDS